jgi:hypothetical protein
VPICAYNSGVEWVEICHFYCDFVFQQFRQTPLQALVLPVLLGEVTSITEIPGIATNLP